MKKEIIISGFGGQGVMSIGKSLVEAGIHENLEVTWVPSYGPEMRGGSANCSVVLSDTKIGAPVFDEFNELIAMNNVALEKFLPDLKEKGNLFVNSNAATNQIDRTDIQVYYIPCDSIAQELGNARVANMVMLGAYAKATKTLKMETLQNMIQHMFTGKKAKMVDINIEALKRGAECVMYAFKMEHEKKITV